MVNGVLGCGKNGCLLWDLYDKYKYTVCTKYRTFSVKSGGTHSYNSALKG
jgi:hypothetical protein